jgi:hypothetical protein
VKDDFGLLECAGCGAQLIVHMDGKVEYQGVKESSQVRDDEPPAGSKAGIGDFPPVEEVMREIDLDELENPAPDPAAASEPTQMRTVVRSGSAHDLVPPSQTGAGYRMPEDDLYDAARDYTAEIAQSALSSDAEPSDDEPPAPPPEPVKEFLGAPEEAPLFDEEQEPQAPPVGEMPADDNPVADMPVGDMPMEDAPAADEADDRTMALAMDPAPEAAPENAADAEPADLFPDFDASAPAPEAVYSSGPVSNSPDLGDVANFGNSEFSGGREGPLRYNLFIEGIDTVDVREAFREAITDRKLMWDTDQILRSVRNGRVNIPNVAPTKAYILITRLRGMPVQVRWEQYAISQT